MLAFGVGIVLAVASWPLTYALGYPVRERSGGVGRIVGIPFFVAYFDSAGHDYVGAISVVSALANATFWLLLPITVWWWARGRTAAAQ